MSAIIFHLTNSDSYPRRYAIEQGATFNWLTFLLDGNYTDWNPSGQIRSNYAEKGGFIKANFEFDTLVYVSAVTASSPDKIGTLIKPILTSEQTQQLDWASTGMQPRTNSLNSMGAIPGKNCWVYDISITSPENVVMRIAEGFVEVSLETTRFP